MNKFHKLLIITSVIASIFGWNIYSTQAQNSLELIEISANTIDSIKDNSILIAQSQPSIGDTVQFAVDAIHKLRQQGKINLRRDGNYTFDDVRIEIDNAKPELLNENPLPGGFYNPFANWITIKNLKQDISVTVQVVGSNSYKSIGYSTPKRVPGKSIDLCCTIYNPR
ncbi:hypothetical protein MEO40_25615 [Dolichospermum sp. ST_sed1]|nr:hypothetical protein [Dolichospermum sp. ST_sed1]MDD1426602.1 hypothetical protein [Dolichospermum sp. ST_sed9]MDD1434458.1 hypothetical protein [Dolichospermum sp. ST_sed6]MDD1442433.1 hypothetical protein [Dolichospermum sp. ST_sed3]MDD1448414.1 hypothetical protein [Dolichospermum sp. ST_sed8]MDD1458169.1 hypothetical protein [Dolichospermum sp. ST_sed7]MDD1462211.1 hypothetical protein [Dolichospermum sp. ST_sed2]MDD1468729.1 hypothetical protein [Dolichospermum sp. ST_sed5]MDD147377